MKHFWKNLLTVENLSSLGLILLSIIATIICLRTIIKRGIARYLLIIPFYFSLITSQLILGTYYALFVTKSIPDKNHPGHIFLAIYLILEYVIIAFLLSKFLKSRWMKSYLITTSVLYSLLVIYCWLKNDSWSEFISIASTVGSLLLIFPCLYFFYELMRDLPTLKLSDEPSFWIVTAVLFLFLWITPIYLAFKSLSLIDLKLIDHLAYATLIILFTKATLCKPQQTI